LEEKNEQAVKDTAKGICDWLKEKRIEIEAGDKVALTYVRLEEIDEICKKYGVEVE
jgi:hypothetical protein